MGALFIIIVLVYFIVLVSRLSKDIHHSKYITNGMRQFRLRRRGHSFYSGSSIRLASSLFLPKLACRLGLHSGKGEYTCERWFCSRFFNARQS